MTWDENKHPRDNEGKFTFKNGESNLDTKESPASILYRDSKIKAEKDRQEAEYKSKLLDILGNKAKSTDVLYGTTKELEEKVKKYGLQRKFKEMSNNKKSNIDNSAIKKDADVRDMHERNIQFGKKIPNQIVNSGRQFITETLIGKNNYGPIRYDIAKNIIGPDTAGMLDLSSGNKNDVNYTKDAIVLQNFDDSRVASDKKYLAKKLYSQFNNEYTKVTNIENIKGYFFKSNSDPSQRIANNDDFKKTIRQNKSKILNGQLVTMEFPNYGYNQKSNLHYAFGHVDIRNGYIDKEGNLRIKVYDTYDFNKTNPTPANQAGRNQMLKGNLKPFFTIHDIIISKKDINELWK